LGEQICKTHRERYRCIQYTMNVQLHQTQYKHKPLPVHEHTN